MRILIAALLLCALLVPGAAADHGGDHCSGSGSIQFCQEGYYCDVGCSYEYYCIYVGELGHCFGGN